MPDVQNFIHQVLAVIIAKLIYQKKVGELYRVLPLSSCSFNVCVSYGHFHFFPYKFQLNENAKALCLYCTDLKGTNISVKVIQWDKLWYDFPVLTVSHYGEQAVSFKKVDLPESLIKLAFVWLSSNIHEHYHCETKAFSFGVGSNIHEQSIVCYKRL